MIKYGLMLGLVMTSGLSAMEMSKDLQKSPDQLQKRWDEYWEKKAAFNAKHGKLKRDLDPDVQAELNALNDEHVALRREGMSGGRAELKSHEITGSQPVDGSSERLGSLAKYCRRIDLDGQFPDQKTKLIDQDHKRTQNKKALEQEIADLEAQRANGESDVIIDQLQELRTQLAVLSNM